MSSCHRTRISRSRESEGDGPLLLADIMCIIGYTSRVESGAKRWDSVLSGPSCSLGCCMGDDVANPAVRR